MPTYHPEPPRLACELQGERDVLSKLRILPSSTHVFCNLRILDPRLGVDREIDFLVLHPEMGVLIIEVKGGRLECVEGGWHRLYQGRREALRESPGAQLQAEQYALLNYLRGQEGWVPRITRILALPHMDVPEGTSFGPDLPSCRILDRQKLDQLLPALRNAVSGEMTWEAFRSGPSYRHHVISDGTMDRLVSALSPRLPPPPSLQEILNGEGEVQDRDARPLLKHLASNFARGRFHVLGAPGSGKSLLARMVGRDWASQGRRVLVLAFNRALTYATQTDLAEVPGVDVATYHDFLMVQLHELGLRPARSQETAVFFGQELPGLFLANLGRMEAKWDALIIDEAQDLQPEWISPLLKLLRDPERDPVLLLEDPSQNLYGRGKHVFGTTWSLDLNLRQNPTLRRAVWESMPECGWGPPEGDEEPGVLIHRKSAPERWKLDLEEELIALEGEGLDPSQVLVLLPHRPERFGLQDGARMGPWRLNTEKDWWEADHAGRVRVNTVHAFKGLEADVVIYLAPAVKAEDTATLRYTALSRARHRAVVLEKALPAIQREAEIAVPSSLPVPPPPRFDPSTLLAPQREALTSALKAVREWKPSSSVSR